MCALFINGAKQLTLFTNGPSALVDAHRQKIELHGIAIVETPVSGVAHVDGYLSGVMLASGEVEVVDALFYRPRLPAAL